MSKSWKDNIKEWTGQSPSSLLRIAYGSSRWAAITADAYVGAPNDSRAQPIGGAKRNAAKIQPLKFAADIVRQPSDCLNF